MIDMKRNFFEYVNGRTRELRLTIVKFRVLLRIRLGCVNARRISRRVVVAENKLSGLAGVVTGEQ